MRRGALGTVVEVPLGGEVTLGVEVNVPANVVDVDVTRVVVDVDPRVVVVDDPRDVVVVPKADVDVVDAGDDVDVVDAGTEVEVLDVDDSLVEVVVSKVTRLPPSATTFPSAAFVASGVRNEG